MTMTMTDDGGRRRLGRGLAALIGDAGDEMEALERVRGVRKAPIDLIRANPKNPRRLFRDEELDELAQSIRQRGLIQPVVVRPAPGGAQGYELIAGERRWRAAQRAGLHEIPVVIQDVSDREAMEIAIIENVQRQDLNPLEEALGYDQLITEFEYTQADLAGIIGKSRSHVANTLRLLKLPDSVRRYLEDGALTAGHARTLVASPDPETLARRIVEEGLTVRAAEAMAQQAPARSATRPAGTKAAQAKDPDLLAIERRMSGMLGLAVEIRHKADGSGEVRIRYETLDQLNDFIDRY
jgi:ParB family chromosome partitioning protein